MELPDDVLAIVRAYSRPRFKYFREYNRALKVLEKEEWPSLKDKLMADGESVMPTLLLYLDAWMEHQQAQIIHLDYYRFHVMRRTLYGQSVMTELKRRCDIRQEKTSLVKSTYSILSIQLYGKAFPGALYGYD